MGRPVGKSRSGRAWERVAGACTTGRGVDGVGTPPLRDNLPVGCWPPLEQRDNQPPVDLPPLEVVLPPLEGESSVLLPVLLVLCCVVPLLLQPRFLPLQF